MIPKRTAFSRRALGVALLLAGTACSPGDRGSWWYRHPGAAPPDAHGIEEVFAGSGALAPADLPAALADCQVTHLYGSYGPLSTNPSVAQIAAFNADLDAAGIESQFLFSEPSYLTDPSSLLTKIQDRVIDFNAPRPAAQRFDAVHLDVEPVQFPECKMATLDPVGCHGRVAQLLSLVAQVRSLLLEQDARDVKLYVDLHVWIDETQGGRVEWPATPTPEIARDSWFAALDAQIDGASLMAYGVTDIADVLDAVDWERANMTSPLRVGIDLDAASGYPDVASLLLAAALLELQPDLEVDLHSLNEILADGGCA